MGHGVGIAWDGTYFRVIDDVNDDKVYSYTTAGRHSLRAPQTFDAC